MIKENLFGKTLLELQGIVIELGFQKFVAKQIANWLYQKRVRSIDEMHNLSKSTRAKLEEKYSLSYTDFTSVQESVDGTKKYLFPVKQHQFIEAAYIPDGDRATLCVSSQVGCKMGCLFCMTGKQGFQGNLTSGEILNQIFNLPEFENLTNVVYMGMGEPMDNLDEVLKSIEILTADYGLAWSPKRITVSTIGIIPAMKRFLAETKAHLAVSLHSPFQEERKNLMPIESVYHLPQLLDEIRAFEFGGQRRVSFEYIMFKDVNDQQKHINELAKILNGIKCRINLIRFHPIPGTPLESSSNETILRFQTGLKRKGILTTIRASRGEDIFAACGLLSTKELVKRQKNED
ncbi:MAG: 23S rRNA (adenine(2503)-C(2))-methyltransferase RlmN, partial [Bacteroidales bacterium]|nr:23S rRNA (adenine(2503)-C(2))-methyltransferase RlmN [Bacteroidales bacterium]